MTATFSATYRILDQISLSEIPAIPGDQDRMPSPPREQPSIPVIPGTGL